MKITKEMKALMKADPRLSHALKTAELLEEIMLHYYHKEYYFEWDPREKDHAAAIKLEVDKKCDNLARSYLTSIYGTSDKWGFIGEESFEEGESAKEFYWCVDPICGSLGYKKKTGNFGTSVALVHKGKAVLGVMNCPVHQWTGAAILEPGHRAAYFPKPRITKSSRIRVVASANKRANGNLQEILSRIGPADISYVESIPVKALGVLLGKYDLFYGIPVCLGGGKYNIWDIAALTAFAGVEKIFLSDSFGNPVKLDPKYYNGIILTRDKALWKKAMDITKELATAAGASRIITVKKPRTYFVSGLKCVVCGKQYQEKKGLLTCPACGEEGILDVEYDYDVILRYFTKTLLARNPDRSHWRYLPLMPVKDAGKIPPLRIGGSPLYDARVLAKALGVRRLFIKDDGINPTASLKDRASSVGVARALFERASAITCASTGNAASSLAGSAASAGLSSFIFVPENAPQAKIAQLLIFGANMFVVKGSYEDAFDLSMYCAREFGFYNRNSGINPYLVEGKKTVSLEMCEQLNWNAPDYVFVAVGDGCTIAGVWKGFVEMHRLGFIKSLPLMFGVQAKGAMPVMKAWESGKPMRPVSPRTLADSIAVGTPRNWRKAVRAVRDSGGFYISVSDEEILSAMKLLGGACGIFGEPAGVTGFAGIIKAVHASLIPSGASVATIITGNGLKDIAAAIKTSAKPHLIPVDYSYVKKIIRKILS